MDVACAWAMFVMSKPEGNYIMDEILKNLSGGHDTVDCLEYHLGKKYSKIRREFVNFVKKN